MVIIYTHNTPQKAKTKLSPPPKKKKKKEKEKEWERTNLAQKPSASAIIQHRDMMPHARETDPTTISLHGPFDPARAVDLELRSPIHKCLGASSMSAATQQ